MKKLIFRSNQFYLIFVSLIISIFIHSDGIIKLFSNNYTAGSFNFIRIIILFSLSLILILSLKVISKKQAFIIILGLLSFSIVLLNSLHGNANQAIYDSICIITFFMICSIFKNERIYNTNIIFYGFGYLFIWSILFTIIAIYFENYYDESFRFSGIFPTSSIFAISTALILVITAKLGRGNIFNISISVFMISLSGTRVALFVACVAPIYMLINNNEKSFNKIFIMMVSISAWFFIQFYFIDHISSLRIISFDDQLGSSNTRIYWYQRAWDYIISTSFFGGGSQSFYLTNGNLLHFDLLRFWVDYSIISVIVILMVVIFILIDNSYNFLYFLIFFIFVFIFPGFHNALQAPELILLCAVALAVPSQYKSRWIHGRSVTSG